MWAGFTWIWSSQESFVNMVMNLRVLCNMENLEKQLPVFKGLFHGVSSITET